MLTQSRPVRHVSLRRWKLDNFIKNRYREMPTEAYLLGTRIASRFVAGCNRPVQGRLWGVVHRADQGWLDLRRQGWTLNTVTRRGIIATDRFDRSTAFSIGEMLRRGLGRVEDYGCLGCHLVVTAGKNYVASCYPNTAELENMKYHGFGTGTNAAAAGDVGLQTELTTEYAVNSTRPTGSQSTTLAVYTTVGTLSPDSGGTLAITEWGLFSATSSVSLLDRQVFSAINLVAGSDSLATTYAHTVG